ncbi:hypothetical protein J6590_078982 [Homalodisca vitripennis]|nr:hypothetical protein J6590_078982 [Homalodisca vitripennis]
MQHQKVETGSAPQNWPDCSQRQHNRINNRIQAHSATDLVECSQRQHNRINNRIHAHSATAHSATGHSATHLAGVLTAPQLIAPHICCGAMRPHQNSLQIVFFIFLRQWCKGDSYGCPFVTSRLTLPLIARLSNLQTVAGHIATA